MSQVHCMPFLEDPSLHTPCHRPSFCLVNVHICCCTPEALFLSCTSDAHAVHTVRSCADSAHDGTGRQPPYLPQSCTDEQKGAEGVTYKRELVEKVL